MGIKLLTMVCFLVAKSVSEMLQDPQKITQNDWRADTQPRECTRNCPKNGEPVCGSNGVTYSNQCMFENAQCEEANLGLLDGEIIYSKPFINGTCSCEEDCPGYNPVCGSVYDTSGIESFTTYINLCKFENALCKAKRNGKTIYIMHRGKCRSPCNRPCTKELYPMCGSNGIEYPNGCYFRMGQCIEKQNGNKLKMVDCKRICDKKNFLEDGICQNGVKVGSFKPFLRGTRYCWSQCGKGSDEWSYLKFTSTKNWVYGDTDRICAKIIENRDFYLAKCG